MQSKCGMEWLIKKAEDCSERYIESEKFILELAQLKWHQRIFIMGRINRFLRSRKKYNF